MPKRALQPKEAAAALLREQGGVRRDAEAIAWRQYEGYLASEGEESMSVRYWLEVVATIADRTETPSVASPPVVSKW